MLTEKLQKFKEIIASYRKCVVAFSGGVDSSLVLFYAVKILGQKNVYPVMFKAPFYSHKEQERGKALIKRLQLLPVEVDTTSFLAKMESEEVKAAVEEGVKLHQREEKKNKREDKSKPIKPVLELIEIDVTDNLKEEALKMNLSQRCYVCKKRGMDKLRKIAEEKGVEHILFGDNADDSPEFRPGMKAVEEEGGKFPLREAGLTKYEIRLLAQLNYIRAWAYASNSCYLTRFPEGKEIKLEKIEKIRKIEGEIRKVFPYVRVRVREMLDETNLELEMGSTRMGDFLKYKKRFMPLIEGLGYKKVYLYLNPKEKFVMPDERTNG